MPLSQTHSDINVNAFQGRTLLQRSTVVLVLVPDVPLGSCSSLAARAPVAILGCVTLVAACPCLATLVVATLVATVAAIVGVEG